MSIAASSPARRPIRVLPPALADQIAAGEVVERPASVVKELVENALDAGARRVERRDRGRWPPASCGSSTTAAGMTPARRAPRAAPPRDLQARGADDLWALARIGFRGEALPSIAAVSRMTITTRTAAAEVATRLVIDCGRVIEEGELGVPAGTQVEVRDLLANQPARLKFLKSESTEEANIYEAVLRLGIAHPEVHLRLKVKGAVRLDLPPADPTPPRRRRAMSSCS